MSNELKPCPFCGETDILHTVRPLHGITNEHIYTCESCGANVSDFKSIDDAVRSWNNRQIEDKLHAEIDRLERALSYVASVVIELEPLEQYTIDSIREVALYETSGGEE